MQRRRKRTLLNLAFLTGLLGVFLAPLMSAAEEPSVDFDRDVRPVLSDYCYACHGPDAASREADLRLDERGGIFREQDGVAVVVPGDPERSELLRRVTATDPEVQMPPADFPRRPSAEQIAVLRQWIEQGATWQTHWSFVNPVRPALPAIERSEWPRTPIDYFVLGRLEQEGLAPAPEAARETLVRRVTLDLTGLPPTPDEVDAFLGDTRPDAYERLVDRLLQSPAFGERLAIDWLDGARYADTSGYQNDGPRSMWRWRDWVIDAFNRNQPFHQFTIEQVAGDLLPDATRAQRIATGFQRNHRGNAEGGIIPEEYAVEYVVDRVETTSTVWLGLTLGCARCHEHKYDPVRQEEFYQLFAFFNNVPEYGRAIKEGNSPPYLSAPTAEQERELAEHEARLAAVRSQWNALQPALAEAQTQWETAALQTTAPVPAESARAEAEHYYPERGLIAHYAGDELPPEAPPRAAVPEPVENSDKKLSASAAPAVANPQRVGPVALAGGVLRSAPQFDGQGHIELGNVGAFGYFDKLSLSAWIRPARPTGVIVSRMTDVEQGDGYSLRLANGHVQLNLVKRWLDDSLRVETERPVPLDAWTHVTATYDGSRRATGIRLYINGQPQPLRVNLDLLNQSFATTEPLRIGAGEGPEGRFQGQIDEVRVYGRVLTSEEAAILAVPESIETLVALPAVNRSEAQQRTLAAFFLARHAPAEWRRKYDELLTLQDAREALVASFPTVMVMEEMSPPRVTHLLERGQYDRPAQVVAPGVPACLPPLPTDQPANRLALARWLVSPEHPLTARVIVNRYWQLLFGTGLVKTAEDFGLQGERPTHPELLDWLAVEMRTSGWDLKHLLRLIVTSSTYRQSSAVSAELWQRDPENRLLARGPRYRLGAEMVRDQALAAAGLLVRHVGGPSVHPYQPEGLWSEIATDTEYPQSHGADLYRRSLYTYWKRTVSPPTMATFDAPSRETCLVRRARTNTPLQALALMNEPGYLEAARHLAARALREGGAQAADRLTFAFRTAAARQPSPHEVEVLLGVLDSFRARYAAEPQAAKAVLAVGETPTEMGDPMELAAYTAVTSLILNLDEVVTKE